jgi:hypothetical protein
MRPSQIGTMNQDLKSLMHMIRDKVEMDEPPIDVAGILLLKKTIFLIIASCLARYFQTEFESDFPDGYIYQQIIT